MTAPRRPTRSPLTSTVAQSARTMPPAGARQQQYARQDRLFGALERLESKDTQAAAFDELQRLIKVGGRKNKGPA